ncbi:hypothetical protein FF38_01893, partial [Lucilia cuprina]
MKSSKDNKEHLEPMSYSWCILRLAFIKMFVKHVQDFTNISGIELQDLPVLSPLSHEVLRTLNRWQDMAQKILTSKGPPNDDYIPGCQLNSGVPGISIHKYRSLLNKDNTPFVMSSSAGPVRRLWNYLVRQDEAQDVFIKAIFGKKMEPKHDVQMHDYTDNGANGSTKDNEPIRIIHKDHESILAFCLNNNASTMIAVANPREVQELDISLLLESPNWYEDECDYDLLGISKDNETASNTGFLMIQSSEQASEHFLDYALHGSMAFLQTYSAVMALDALESVFVLQDNILSRITPRYLALSQSFSTSPFRQVRIEFKDELVEAHTVIQPGKSEYLGEALRSPDYLKSSFHPFSALISLLLSELPSPSPRSGSYTTTTSTSSGSESCELFTSSANFRFQRRSPIIPVVDWQSSWFSEPVGSSHYVWRHSLPTHSRNGANVYLLRTTVAFLTAPIGTETFTTFQSWVVRMTYGSSLSPESNLNYHTNSSQSGRGTDIILKHKIDNVKRMSAHPLMPLYLTGGQDGSVQIWEWGHQQVVCTPRPSGTFAKVTRCRFSEQGNKFGIGDGDGNLSLWQAGIASQNNRSFFTHQCHNKTLSDFVFLGSCSLLATAGQSSENKNIIVWDTLLPQKKSCVSAFTCHDQGASCFGFAPQHQLLISCGKKGDICVFDMRQRTLKHRLQGHDSCIKCISIDPHEEFFATGSIEGDIKIWSLNQYSLISTFTGEHAKNSFFKHIGQGVSQIYIDAYG